MTMPTVAIASAVEPPTTIRRLITGEELYRMAGLGPTDLVRGEIEELLPGFHLSVAELFADE
jgi:hypothetical protein